MPRSARSSVHHTKLVLVGASNTGQVPLCLKWSPKLAPQDGYHVYHSYSDLMARGIDLQRCRPTTFSRDAEQEYSFKVADPISAADVGVFLMILNPFQDGPHAFLTKFVMMRTDVVALCYSVNDAKTLDEAVTKWFPFIRHHLPSTPVVLIGCRKDVEPVPQADSLAADIVSEGERQPQDPPNPVTEAYLMRAIEQIEAADSLRWSQTKAPESISDAAYSSPEEILYVLAWYGLYSDYARIREERSSRQCVIA